LAPRLKAWGAWAARESGGVLFKDTVKYLVWTSGALIGGWLLALTSQIFHLDEPLTKERLQAKLIEVLGQLWAHPYDWSVGLIKRDPVHSVVALLFATAIVVLIVLFRRARWRLKSQSRILEEAAVDRALAKKAGIGGRWPHAKTTGEDGAPWHELCAEILRPGNTTLEILGANGIETFGERGSPLYDVLEKFHGTTRVILSHPDSTQTAGRAADVGVPIGEYRRAIRISTTRLKQLRRQHRPIEGRYYDAQPNWKLIITSRTLWVQYYIPGGSHVNETPVWRFDATDEEHGLYHYFDMEFDRIWRRCEENAMDLS
jgi:hypothetical protein